MDMLKKAFAAAAVAAALTLTGASAATAASGYPAAPPVCEAVPTTIAVGETSTITCVWVDDELDGRTVTFSTQGPAVRDDTLSSLVFASEKGSSSATAPIAGRTAAVTFTGPAERVYPISVSWSDETEVLLEVPITVTQAADAGPDAGAALPSTGGTVPTEALWIGVGAVGLGAIAVYAAVARRRRSHR